MIGISLDKNGFGMDHTPQKNFEIENRRMKMTENTKVKETLEKIRMLESEGKFDEAKELRKTVQSING